ncbi:hypothetical protein [Tepidibacter sp. Z1-5]|uniref:hypothetical protein n=1 Tax=Tepidibacter sp. Z1-5 TaxID=3134138 RepID=UPI0030C4BDAD
MLHRKIEQIIGKQLTSNKIKDRNYRQELVDKGIKNIIEIGIAFEGKEVLVKELNR